MYVVFCSEQLDGLASASIIFRLARLRSTNCKIGGFINYNTINEDFNELLKLKGDLIFILDISPEQIINLDEKLLQISKSNKIVYWNSHHKFNSKTREIIKKYTNEVDFAGGLLNYNMEKEKICSAELTCKRFIPNDFIARQLAYLAHDIEFWVKKDERSTKLTDLINSGFDKKELVEIISRGVFWSSRFDIIRNAYLEKKQRALMDLNVNIKIKNYLRYRFGFALASNLLNSADAGEAILRLNQNIDVAVLIFRNAKISFRKNNNCSLNLLEIAKLFSGGGHNYAAGGKLENFKIINNDNFENAIFTVDHKIKDFFLK